MRHPPTLPPDDNRGPAMNIVGWVGAGITIVFVLLRLYSRTFVTRSLGWDDVLIVIGLLLNIVALVLISVAVDKGLGRHIGYLGKEELKRCLLFITISRAPGILSYCVPKLSVVILLVKLTGTARKGVWLLYSVIFVLFVTNILGIILFFVRCSPPRSLWDPFIESDCMPSYILNNTSYVAGAWSAFTDVVLATFPIFLLWNLQMKKSRKFTAIMVMALGFLASIVAIAKTTQLSANNATDATWESFWLFITTYIEADLVLIAACAPTLPTLVRKISGREVKDTTASYPQNKPSSSGYHAFSSDHELVTVDPKDPRHPPHQARQEC